MRQQALAWWRGLTWREKCAIIQEQVRHAWVDLDAFAVETRTDMVDKSSIQIERVFRATQEKEN